MDSVLDGDVPPGEIDDFDDDVMTVDNNNIAARQKSLREKLENVRQSLINDVSLASIDYNMCAVGSLSGSDALELDPTTSINNNNNVDSQEIVRHAEAEAPLRGTPQEETSVVMALDLTECGRYAYISLVSYSLFSLFGYSKWHRSVFLVIAILNFV